MGQRIYITGASGAGTTTLGRALAKNFGLNHIDVDDAYWAPSELPYSCKRKAVDRVAILRDQMTPEGWVMSGSFDTWGDPLLEDVDLVLFVSAPTTVRLARLRQREFRRFGDRIKPGGDMASIHRGFMAWAGRYDDPSFSGRNRARHLAWLDDLRNDVMHIDGTRPMNELIEQVASHRALVPSYA